MEIVELSSFEEGVLRDLDLLMHELSPSSVCAEKKLQRLVDSPDSHLYVVRSTKSWAFRDTTPMCTI